MAFTTKYNANLTASTKTANLMQGDINEFITQRSLVNVYAVSSAIGVNMTLMADSDVAVDDKEIPFIGTTLDKQAHLMDSFYVGPGTRLAVFLRETAAVATTDVYFAIEIVPV